MDCPIQTCKARVEKADPVNHVTEDDPPFLIVHGQIDDMVPYGQSLLLFDALRAACVDVRFISLPNHKHEHRYLDDPNDRSRGSSRPRRGATRRRGGQAPAATYDTIRRFFDSLLEPTASSPVWSPAQSATPWLLIAGVGGSRDRVARPP